MEDEVSVNEKSMSLNNLVLGKHNE